MARSHARAPTTLDPASTSPLRDAQVLVVDDDEDTRRLLSCVLSHVKARVTSAATAANAFETLQTLKPHLLISDIQMPGEDGVALLQRVRQLPDAEGGRTPAIALTGESSSATREAAAQAGFDVLLLKPVSFADLIQTAANLVARH